MLTGSPPPIVSLPPAANAPPSPLAQKSKSSSVTRVMYVKASYSSATSMSPGVTPACSKAVRPETAAGETVKSSHSDIVVWETAVPAPRTHTGGFAASAT